MKRRYFATLLLALAASVVLSGCARRDAAAGETGGDGNSSERVVVTAVSVERTDFVEYGIYFGESRALSEARIIATAGGTVQAVHARPGDLVRRGDSLARINAQRAQTAFDTAVLAERLARETVERERRFLEQGVSPQQRVDQAQLEWLNSRSALIDATTYRDGALAISPIDGIVAARYVNPHDEIAPGTTTFRVADLSRLRISVGVPEADIAGVQQLESAEVRFSSYPDRVWTGNAISYARVRSERGLTFDVEIEIDNSDGTLLSGQTARARLALRTIPDAVTVPTRAIVIRGNEFSVFTVEEGTARRRRVTIGPSDATVSVVLQGLTGTETIVLEGMNRLADETPVSVAE